MRKRMMALMLAGAMILGITGCGNHVTAGSSTTGNTGSGSSTQAGTSVGNKEYTKLVVSFRTFGTTPTDIVEVQNKINELTRKKIEAEVELMIIPSGSYRQQMTLMLSGDEQLDVMGAPSSVIPSAYAGEQIRPLNDLLDQYGQGIKDVLGDVLKCGQFAGEMYCIPIMADTAAGYGGFMLRKDLCEKYGINTDSVRTYGDITKIFEVIHENEPDMTVLAPYSVGYSFMQFCINFDKLGDYFGVLADHGQNLNVVNLFETEEYKEYLTVFRDWYQKGYISSDVTNATEAGAALMKAGNLFAYTQATKPGIETQEKNSSGHELIACQVLDTFTVTGNVWQWTIPENSRNQEKAMQFINLMYTDKDLINLMAYGIEGKHYEVKEDGTVGYPDGVDSSNSGYNMGNMVWSFGNEFNAHVWNGNDPAVWEQTKEWNQTGIVSKAYGFVFNNTSVANEIAAVQNVYDQYRMSLECGVMDIEPTLQEMNEKLYAAGLQTIIDEKQKQLDEWAIANGKRR